MSIFISGSVAYDTILRFEGVFADHLLPNSLKTLNLTLQTPVMHKHFGGCAANIAYSLKSLRADPLIVTTVGADATSYLEHFKNDDIRTDAIKVIEDAFTAQAFITTDALGNQLTAFHEGAMARADEALPQDNEAIEFGIISPTATRVMKAHVNYLNGRNIPVMWDMGQASAYVTAEDIVWFIEHVDILTLSSYEWDVLEQKTGLTTSDVSKRLKALIITQGALGSELYTEGRHQHFPALPLSTPANPVGCGDAFRGALLRGLTRGFDWTTTMQLASLMGALKAQSAGAQALVADKDEIKRLFHYHFGYAIEL